MVIGGGRSTMGIGVILLMSVMSVLLAVSFFVALSRQQSKPIKQVLRKDILSRDVNENLLLIEHAPADMRKLEIGFKASAKIQDGLLYVGRALLRKLPGDICACLGCPISCDRIEQLSQGNNQEAITPEHARVAIGVAEAVFAIWNLMFEFEFRANPPYPVIFDGSIGVLVAGKQIFSERYIVARISHYVGISAAAATAIWHGMAEILREGIVSVPGLRAKAAITISRSL
jgi:hypothetical protein